MLSLVGCWLLWRKCERLEAAREVEHLARLSDAKATTTTLVEFHQEELKAIERLEMVAEMMTSGRSRPVSPLSGSSSDGRAFVRSQKGPAE